MGRRWLTVSVLELGAPKAPLLISGHGIRGNFISTFQPNFYCITAGTLRVAVDAFAFNYTENNRTVWNGFLEVIVL